MGERNKTEAMKPWMPFIKYYNKSSYTEITLWLFGVARNAYLQGRGNAQTLLKFQEAECFKSILDTHLYKHTVEIPWWDCWYLLDAIVKW